MARKAKKRGKNDLFSRSSLFLLKRDQKSNAIDARCHSYVIFVQEQKFCFCQLSRVQLASFFLYAEMNDGKKTVCVQKEK